MTRSSFGSSRFPLLAAGTFGEAQQPAKIPRIGYLAAILFFFIAARTEAFQQGLRELGYIDGKSIVIEYRYADGKADRLLSLATELIQLKVDVIVTVGPTATRPVKDATLSIPIVMAADSDPVGNGFVASLARPGGNITVFLCHVILSPELSGKQLELLKEVAPRLSRVAVLGASRIPATDKQ